MVTVEHIAAHGYQFGIWYTLDYNNVKTFTVAYDKRTSQFRASGNYWSRDDIARVRHKDVYRETARVLRSNSRAIVCNNKINFN